LAWEQPIGGAGGRNTFATTHWAAIYSARASGDPGQTEALGQLLAEYWRPVYWYLRRKGHASADACDLVQGFFYDVVLRRGLLESASPANGRFRTLLLRALNRYCANVRRHIEAKKRRPPGGWLSLDELGAPRVADENPESDPERAYHYAWASKLLDAVLSAVEAGCRSDGMQVHWELFRERVLDPILSEADHPALPALCRRYQVADQAKVSNMIVTVKRRLQREMERRLRQLVGSDAEVAQEINELREILSKKRAR